MRGVIMQDQEIPDPFELVAHGAVVFCLVDGIEIAIRERLDGTGAPRDAAAAFERLAGDVAAFDGLSYERLGGQGAWLKGWEKGPMPPVGRNPNPGVRAPVVT